MSTPYTTHSAHDAGEPSGLVCKEKSADLGEAVGLQRVQVAQVPSAVREAIFTLLVGQGLDAAKCERILEQFLRYARVWQRELIEGGEVAVITIANLLKLHKRDHWTCCCYQTANTFLRLLCALGILRKHRGPGGVSEYYLPLAEGFVFQPTDDMLTALDALGDPAQTKNKRVRDKAHDVKSRLLLLCTSSTLRGQPQVAEAPDAELADLTGKMRDALVRVEGLLHSVGKLEGRTRKQVMAGVGAVLVELFQFVRKSTSHVDSLPPGWGWVGEQEVDSVDSPCPARAAKRQARTGEGRSKSTDLVDSARAKAQNLPVGAEMAEGSPSFPRRGGETASQNLPSTGQAVDSAMPIDNGRNISENKILSSPPPQNNNSTVTDTSPDIDSDGARASKRPMLPGCLKLKREEARELARAVEHNDGHNFPAYITLSKTCTRQAIRAAVVNMLAHRYFPDRDGSLDSEVDGEITGKWGSPKRPGAWVTDEARAYQQSGIPRVMQLLLSCLESQDGQHTPYSYPRIERQLLALAQQRTPEEFWYGLQQELCNREAAAIPATEGQVGDGFASTLEEGQANAGAGLAAGEAKLLVERIEREGAPYAIAARPRRQEGGTWVVELLDSNALGGVPERATAGDVLTGLLYSEREWLNYFTLVQEWEGEQGTLEA